jgi:hypothetical protein
METSIHEYLGLENVAAKQLNMDQNCWKIVKHICCTVRKREVT